MRWRSSGGPDAVLVALLAAASVARAQVPPEPERSTAEGRHPTATGTLAAYDPATRVLAVRNATGSQEFLVAADARLWRGSRRLPVGQLGAYLGAQITLAWSEAGGVRTTHTVRVTDPRPVAATGGGPPSRTEALSLRGVSQALHLYGTHGKVAIVSSGDGGWVHLGPQVAEFLAGEGYRVVGFDAKAYLSSFTSRSGPLRVDDVPRDYETLVEYATRGAPGRPLLVGVSEGGGLSVLAATAPEVQSRIVGVLALGLPDQNELGWRWRDSIIYVTKQTPNEPTFRAREVVGRVSPVPLAALHSTHDEFVALPEIRDVLAQAREPKRLWVIEAADHRFSNSQAELQRRLKEAIAWIESQRSAAP